MLKTILFILLVAYSLLTAAKPTPSISHTHEGRIHSHPLPQQGVAHRHGSGALGLLTENISTLVTGEPETKFKRPAPRNHTVISSTVQLTQSSHDFLPLDYTHGNINCRSNQEDCNVCASNVQKQFNKVANRKISWGSKPWRFNWPQQYAPYGLRPLDIFDGVPAYALGIPDTHIQGFIRTNSSKYPYAGTHSHKTRGGVFIVKQKKGGKKYLSSLHQTKGRHPSGIHVIGKYVVYGEGKTLVFKDLNSKNQAMDIRLNIPKAGFGGGLGIVKLSSNSHLVITSGPGGQDERPRYHRYYSLKFKNSKPVSLSFISESISRVSKQWPKGFSFTENLSLITECGTGDIYTIHTSGDEKGISAITGNGYWRLSKLQKRSNILTLHPISAFINKQNMSSCNVRATGTVFVNSKHNLEFYCHGYAKDPDGSLFNVLGSSSRGQDKFRFKVGVVR